MDIDGKQEIKLTEDQTIGFARPKHQQKRYCQHNTNPDCMVRKYEEERVLSFKYHLEASLTAVKEHEN